MGGESTYTYQLLGARSIRATLASKLRLILLVHHPGTTFSNLRTAEEEQHVEFLPYQTTPPILQFYNANPGTTSKPLQAGELDCFAFPVFWPDGFVPCNHLVERALHTRER